MRMVAFVSVVAPAVLLRVWEINALGFNSDEAVYAGQGASIAGHNEFLGSFPVFRAHPLLFQSVLSVLYRDEVSDLVGRLAAATFGVATVGVVYLFGREMYGRSVGYVAALLMAVMPYHVVVTRQVLLDGPMTFFAALTLLLIAKHAKTSNSLYFYLGAGALGLAVISKEPAVLFIGGVYAFYALARVGHVRLHQVIVASTLFVLTVLPFPLSLKFSGRTSTGNQFLSYQIFRKPNHTWTFYFTEVPPAMGRLVLAAAAGGLIALWPRRTWREALLCCWIVVPLGFFELWPVKGFQYLLPTVPAVTVLAARAVVSIPREALRRRYLDQSRWITSVAVLALVVSLALPSWHAIQPSNADTNFLAGSGGVPGGREAGRWVAENVPEGARMLAIGPSMANIVMFYGHRETYGLSVSPNPLHRNPVYEPVVNPDNLIRQSEIQYLVWDAYTASRTEFFTRKLERYVERYHGRAVYTFSIEVEDADGKLVQQPVIVIYEVRP